MRKRLRQRRREHSVVRDRNVCEIQRKQPSAHFFFSQGALGPAWFATLSLRSVFSLTSLQTRRCSGRKTTRRLSGALQSSPLLHRSITSGNNRIGKSHLSCSRHLTYPAPPEPHPHRASLPFCWVSSGPLPPLPALGPPKKRSLLKKVVCDVGTSRIYWIGGP